MIDFMIVKDIGTDLELIAMMLFVIVADSGKATILIKDGLINVQEGLAEKPDLVITADVSSWLKIVNREADQNMINEIFTSGKIKVQGNMADLQKFQNCFVGQ